MTSPDFGRITKLNDDPVLIIPSIRPLSPSTRNAWPSGMLKKLMSLTQTQCGLGCDASCSALNGSAGRSAGALGAAAAARQAPTTRRKRPDVLMEPSRRRWLPAPQAGTLRLLTANLTARLVQPLVALEPSATPPRLIRIPGRSTSAGHAPPSRCAGRESGWLHHTRAKHRTAGSDRRSPSGRISAAVAR